MQIKKAITEESRKLWPRPMDASSIRKFFKANGKLQESEILVKWGDLKSRHIAYWRDRYGLDDAKPFRMVEGNQLANAKWEYCSENGNTYLRIVFTYFNGNIPLKVLTPIGSQSDIASIIKLKLKTYADQHDLICPAIQDFPIPGSTVFFQKAEPEHDWLVWRKGIEYELAESHISVKANWLDMVINKYKSGKLDTDGLKELADYIKTNANKPC